MCVSTDTDRAAVAGINQLLVVRAVQVCSVEWATMSLASKYRAPVMDELGVGIAV